MSVQSMRHFFFYMTDFSRSPFLLAHNGSRSELQEDGFDTNSRQSTVSKKCSLLLLLLLLLRKVTLENHASPEEGWRYSSTLCLDSAVVGGGSSTPRAGRFTTGKEKSFPLCRGLGGPQGRSGRVWKISPQL